MTPPVVIDNRYGELTAVGLVLVADIRFNDWRQIGEALFLVKENVMWAIADWAAYGERQYRRDYGEAVEAIYTRQGIYDLASVARRVEISRRRENLTFSHHREVAALEPDLQTVWLDDAERQGWTRDELRAQIATVQGRKTATPALTFKAIGETYDLCLRAAELLEMDPGQFALEAIEAKARDVLGRRAA